MGGEPGITVQAFVRRDFDPADKTQQELGRWKVTTFPPEVCEHFVIMLS
jgi:hypothetical protein